MRERHGPNYIKLFNLGKEFEFYSEYNRESHWRVMSKRVTWLNLVLQSSQRLLCGEQIRGYRKRKWQNLQLGGTGVGES